MQWNREPLIATSAVVVLLTACNSSASTSIGNPSNPSTGSSASIAAPDGMYSGRDKYPISFTVTSGVITDLHGTVTLYCAGGPSPISQESPYSDADRIQLDSSGSFSDDYHYAVGNGTWTLHIDGTLTGDGTATGFVSILGVGCSAGRTGWAAALPGAQLPVAPASPPPASAVACTPQPCQTLNGVTLSVQSATLVSKPDDPSAKGVDVALSIANDSDAAQRVQNQGFSLKFGNGDVAQTGDLGFVDSSGQSVPCFSGQTLVPPGQQLQDQHVCLTLGHDETGQQMTLVWVLLGPAFAVPIGTLQ